LRPQFGGPRLKLLEDVHQHEIDFAAGNLARERKSQTLLAGAAGDQRPRPGEPVKRMMSTH
jgi:hypothetical protein